MKNLTLTYTAPFEIKQGSDYIKAKKIANKHGFYFGGGQFDKHTGIALPKMLGRKGRKDWIRLKDSLKAVHQPKFDTLLVELKEAIA